MRNDEIVKRNVSLVFDFLRYLTEHPEMIDKIPDGCELEFLDKDFPVTEAEPGVEGAEKVFLKVEHTFVEGGVRSTLLTKGRREKRS